MTANRTVTQVSIFLFLATLAGSVFSLRAVDAARGKEATIEEVLYLPSGKTVKRLSLGYHSLLADIYWTRAVQYFGGRHGQSKRYDLLYPLLDIATDLDPQLIEVYQSGSVLLSQPVPEGAGQPDKAVTLLEKGIRENPTYWRLYFTLGFVHYMDRHDPKSAEEAFTRGSNVKGALPFMKVMAARMAERSDDMTTAVYLWKAVYDITFDPTVKDTAMRHLASLQVMMDITELTRRVQFYQQKTGAFPAGWPDLVRAGLLQGIPLDPNGTAYKLMPYGMVQVEDPSKFPYLNR
jgi:tetratricopeptide (TPR) repeat protein